MKALKRFSPPSSVAAALRSRVPTGAKCNRSVWTGLRARTRSRPPTGDTHVLHHPAKSHSTKTGPALLASTPAPTDTPLYGSTLTHISTHSLTHSISANHLTGFPVRYPHTVTDPGSAPRGDATPLTLRPPIRRAPCYRDCRRLTAAVTVAGRLYRDRHAPLTGGVLSPQPPRHPCRLLPSRRSATLRRSGRSSDGSPPRSWWPCRRFL